jgi:hypothetical protein
MAEYKAQWAAYRRIHRQACLALVPGIFVAPTSALALSVFVPVSPGFLVFGTTALWALVWGRLAFRVARFPCPRCQAHLASERWCSECGLRLYEQA